MPRYYFHLYNDVDVPDLEGDEHPDLESAKASAKRQARALIGDDARMNGRITLHHRIDIEDTDRKVVATVKYSDVLNILE
ncbi:MAG: hypothetical protein HOP96_08495 [Sphingomonas sp.]|nr:hypothetical protein [Sphingomonas sp.]